MEDKLTELDGRVDKLEKNDIKLSSEIGSLREVNKRQDDRLDTHGRKLDTHGKKLDSLSRTLIVMEGNNELIKKDVENIDRTTKKTEDKLDNITNDFQKESYCKPLGRYEKIRDTIVIIVVTACVTFILTKMGLN